CKWQNEKAGIQILRELQKKADIFSHRKGYSWYVLFSKSGFTEAVLEEAKKNNHVILVDLQAIVNL
ncbi:MAG: restriction endonuclease, partial [Victivallales bacterium]|nr:restriction endonuclease [Victivallales bacterium]